PINPILQSRKLTPLQVALISKAIQKKCRENGPGTNIDLEINYWRSANTS
ncbi:Hypothetical predicted protein, partial [Podarcis lilfordi]